MADAASRSRAGRAAAVALLALALPAGAQDDPAPAGTFGERVEVEVVDVDVVVTDRAGRPVLDLARSELELWVDGERVEFSYFARPRGSVETAAPAEQRAPARVSDLIWDGVVEEESAEASSLLVVYVDQAALQLKDRKQAVDEIREFLSRRSPAETTMVAAFEDRLRVLAPPSTDADALERALLALEKLPLSAQAAVLEGREMSNRVRGTQISWYRTAGADGGPEDGELSGAGESPGRQAERQALADYWEQHASALEYEVRRWAELETARFRRSIGALTQLVGALGALDGRKSVVLVTGGATTESGEGLLELLSVQRGNASANKLSPRSDAKNSLRLELDAMVRAAQNARVALYTVTPTDPTSLESGADLASAGRDTLRAQPRDPAIADAAASVARMSGATGGTTLLLGGDLDTRLERVRVEAVAAYSLGFVTGPEAGTGDHEIEVRVSRPGTRVRHRESYRRRTAGEAAEQSLYAAAAFGEQSNPLGVELELGASRPAEDDPHDRLVPVATRIPLAGLALTPDGVSRRARLRFRVALESDLGELFLAPNQPVPVEVEEADLERALGGFWVHRVEVRVPPGTRRLAVLVLDELGGVASAVSIELPESAGV